MKCIEVNLYVQWKDQFDVFGDTAVEWTNDGKFIKLEAD